MGIPPHVKIFIGRHIHSVWQLETLLCLKRSNGKTINSHEVAKELYISEDAVSKQLNDLVRIGVAEQEQKGVFKYKPSSPDLSSTLDILDELYSKRRVAITDAIYRQSNPSMQFSEAFDLKGDEI